MKQVIAHIDMDCFFCACEVKRNPELIDKPVIVGSTGSRGVVSASNYTARKFNVYSATPISKARVLCPDGIFLPVDMNFYKKESNKIMSILKLFTNIIKQVSVDEAYLDLTDFAKKFPTIEGMTNYIKGKIKKETKLTCSIGVSHSATVSKIASDYNKPNGITIVKDIPKFLAPLNIEKIPGIGKVSKSYYNNNGVTTIQDLIDMNRFDVLEKFKMQGAKYQDIALGKDYSKIKFGTKCKSFSRETTFTKDVSDFETIKEELFRNCYRIYRDLKNDKIKYAFKTISIKIRYSDFSTITRDFTFKTLRKSINEMLDKAYILLKDNLNINSLIRLIGVKITNLKTEITKQTTLLSFI